MPLVVKKTVTSGGGGTPVSGGGAMEVIQLEHLLEEVPGTSEE